MRIYPLLTLLLLAPALAAGQDSVTPDRLAIERDLAAARVRYGEAHPRIVELTRRAEGLPAPDASAELCASLDAVRSAREADLRQMRARYGPRHLQRMALEARLRTVRAQLARLCPAARR